MLVHNTKMILWKKPRWNKVYNFICLYYTFYLSQRKHSSGFKCLLISWKWYLSFVNNYVILIAGQKLFLIFVFVRDYLISAYKQSEVCVMVILKKCVLNNKTGIKDYSNAFVHYSQSLGGSCKNTLYFS